MQPQEIAVLAFHDISPFQLSVPSLVFGNRIGAGLPSYNLRICAGEPVKNGGLRTTAGFAVQTDLTLEDAGRADVLIVPSWRDTDERLPAPMVNAVHAAYERGATVVGLCLGAFVLSSGYMATTLTDGPRWPSQRKLSLHSPNSWTAPSFK